LSRAERLLQVQKDAWIGDAVLSLWVRLRILRDDGALDGPKYARLTSNECLGLIAEPSETEARIGRAYAAGGLEQAFAYIEEHLQPVFEKREANRLKKQQAHPARRN
jgi:hypothetical protein